MMMQSLITAGQRLAEALAEENEALARLDLLRAAKLADAKIRASEAFSAAHVAVHRTGARIADETQREETEQLSLRLKDLSDENRRLLERAIALQAKVIETRCRNAGVLVNAIGDHVIRLAPPLILTAEQADQACTVLGEAITS